ncbi:MAG: peptide deformylase [Nanoarchaeota archaeon]|nr:peptide deformylase [Nanoarchaeota archaeon]MBU1643656.1 peptide deformylase [Nanoarchaeota archaeon]MBU1977351.1 peptide deformylase [Nanoarchaeota archaeon]
MAVKSIVKIGEELLRKESLPILDFGTEELKQLEEDLRDTLLAFREKHGYGRGIAAVQIGNLQRTIYVKTEEFEGMLVNPKIVKKSEKMFWTWDSCFSADIAFFVKILRHFEIEVEYFDISGEKKLLKATDELSELLQHEIDHLDGKLFIDYLDKDKKLLFMKDVFEKLEKK